jgi:4a-hydroxytetrahydrobiopterin dehydratase
MSSEDLAEKTCVPCKGGVPPLKGAALAELAAKLGGGWNVVNEHHLEKAYTFKNFRGALEFTNAAGAIAEEQGHHPQITLEWGKAAITTWTHKIDGLTESDFILAAKLDKAYEAKRANVSSTPVSPSAPHM